VAQVAIAAGRDDTLPTLTGIRVEISDTTITLAATDRYRLAVREFPWSPEHSGLDTNALVPARTLADTAKALAHCDVVHLALSASGAGDGLMGFEGDGRRTTTRLLDGEFPKYRALLPSESASVASVETSALVDAVKRVALVAERNTPVRLTFSGDEVELRAGAGDEAQATEAVECAVDGDAIEIAFNPQYLLDGLSAVESSTTRLSFTSSTRPAVLTGGSGDSVPSYRYLLMPVRLSG
jgi:DNA polymerase-3 subunit beta